MCEYRLSRKKNSVDIDLLALLQDSDFNEAEVDAFKDEFTKRSLEMDEIWSYCHDKKQQDWLWWAIDHDTGVPIAFCFGTREYKTLDNFLKLIKTVNIRYVYTDNNFAYSSRIPKSKHRTGKQNTQLIERKHLTLRTRLKRVQRKTIGFSKKLDIHRGVIGLFINLEFFHREIDLSLF